jgi:hypothetical protein
MERCGTEMPAQQDPGYVIIFLKHATYFYLVILLEET